MVAFGDKFFIKKKCSFAAKLKTKISNFFPSCEFGPGSFFFFFWSRQVYRYLLYFNYHYFYLSAQLVHNFIMTSYQLRCDVMTSHRC